MLTRTILAFAVAAAVSFGGAWFVHRASMHRRLPHAMLVTGLQAAGWLCAITAALFVLVAYKGLAR